MADGRFGDSSTGYGHLGSDLLDEESKAEADKGLAIFVVRKLI